jgi:hypothetical protein
MAGQYRPPGGVETLFTGTPAGSARSTRKPATGGRAMSDPAPRDESQRGEADTDEDQVRRETDAARARAEAEAEEARRQGHDLA